MLKSKLLQGNIENDLRVELDAARIEDVRTENNKIRKWKKLNSFPLKFIYEKYPKLLVHVKYFKSGTGSAFTKAKIPEEMTTELAYVLGAMRDGSLIKSSGKHWVRLYDSAKSKWIEEVQKIFEEIFEVKFAIRYQKKIDEKYLDISSKPLCLMMENLVDGKLHKGIPKIIRNSSKKTQIAYICGFFDAEGHVPSKTVKHKRFRITFTQKDDASLIFIKNVLSEFGIKTSKISNYSFAIYGKEMIMKFHHNFELLNPNKLERLEEMLNTSTSRSYPGDIK